jgi:hypothetical protein
MIRKAVVEVIVLFDDREVEPAFFEEATLGDLERLMEDEAVGLHALKSIGEVDPTVLESELHALGDSGTFFDEKEED